MTIFRRLRHRRALQAADEAQDTYNTACARKDTRAMHSAWIALRAARLAAMRLEVR